jgi:hypothetical protein
MPGYFQMLIKQRVYQAKHSIHAALPTLALSNCTALGILLHLFVMKVAKASASQASLT